MANRTPGFKGTPYRGGTKPCVEGCACGRHKSYARTCEAGCVCGRHPTVSLEDKYGVVDLAYKRSCADCGERYPKPVMDLDHVYGEKLFPLGGNRIVGKTLQEIVEEISKCETVCANCHRMRTAVRGGWEY